MSFFLLAGAAGAGDVARVDALLVQAQALLASARAELAAPTTNDTPQSGAIDLAAFAWAKGKTSDPAGLPAGARYGEGVESGRRTCQWHYGTWILHAVFSAAASSANGKSVRWYHFTRTGQPHPGLSAYRWQNTHVTEGWYRWAGAQ